MTNPGDANQDRPIDAETYERLCARLLGELEGADATKLDADCADSEALTSERERIAATIALVQDTYRAEPALSEAAMAKVMAAARQEGELTKATPVARVHQLPWWRNSGLRAAAAVAALVGGVFGVLAIEGGSPAVTHDRVAGLDRSERVGRENSRLNSVSGDREKLASLESSRPGAESEGAPAESSSFSQLDEARRAKSSGDTNEQQRVLDDMQDSLEGKTSSREYDDRLQALESLVQQQSDAKNYARRAEREPVRKAAAGEDTGVDRDLVSDVTNGLEDMAKRGLETGGSGKSGEGAAGPPSAGFFFAEDGSTEAKTGADDFFLGREQNKKAGEQSDMPALASKDAARAELPDLHAGAGGGAGGDAVDPGVYPGPADSIKPESATTAPGPASPAGPSSPGPTAPGSSAPTAADKTTEARKELHDGLSSLGYATTEEAGKTELRGLGAPGLGNDGSKAFNDFGDQSAADDLSDGRDNSLGDFYDDDSDTRARAELTEEQLNKLTAAYSDDFFRSCQPQPSERPRDMFFRFYGDNPFEYAPQDKRSTFSVDVDTASYTLSRSYLSRGLLPEKAQVRTEEFLNYFDADLPAPNDDVFAITTEVAPSRFGGTPDRLMLRVGVRGKEISKEERDPLALTFVVDVSGSMREGDRLELVKHALRLLLTQLDARDRISLVAFSNEARVVLPMTPATERALIEAALHPLQPGGGTNAEAGLTVGYELAMTGIDPKVTSRVIFLSDGVANIGQTDQDRLGESVTRQREQGIYLNTVGVGMNNHNDVFLERLADQGDGVCDYVDDADSAKRALVDRFTGALLPIASDVKVQVVFDESVVARYRLLGYENRAIADADFRNDAVDAGEIGAGHQVVALYELDLAPRAEPLASGYPMASVLLRWKEPKCTGQHPLEIQVTEIEKQVAFPGATTPFAETSLGFRRNALVAQFAEFLRRSTHAQGDSIQELLAEATALAPLLNDGDFDEFVTLVRRAEPMLVAEQIRVLQNELGITMNEYRRLAYNRALLAELNLIQGNAAVLEGIRDANLEVEGQIRDLIYRQLKNR